MVRNQNNLVEIVTGWPSTKIAKTNLIHQKTWLLFWNISIKMPTLMEISCLNLYESPSEISLKHFWFGLNHSIIPFSESLLLFGPLSHYSDRVKIDSDQQFMKIHCDSDIICNDSEAFRCSSEKFRKGSEAFSHESEILRSIQTWLRSIQNI